MPNSAAGSDYAAETELARAAAERAGLGRPGQAFANTKLGFGWREKETGSLVYEFDGGLVSQEAGGRTEVFPWTRISKVTRIGTHESKNGRYALTQFVYTVTRDDGAVMELRGSYVSPERRAGADPESRGARFNRLGDAVSRRVSAAKLPAAREALARGEHLQFGMLTISTGGVVERKGTVAWNQIRDVRMRNGVLDIYQAGRKLALTTLTVSSVPNLPLLLALLDELRS